MSVVLGVVAAVRGGWLDSLLQGVSIVAFAVPNFLIALVLALVFAVQLGIFPALGYTPFAEDPRQWLASITLPAIALAIGAIATVATQTRGSMIDVLQQDYVRTLRSRGLPTRQRAAQARPAQRRPGRADRAVPAVHRPDQRRRRDREGVRPQRHRRARHVGGQPGRRPARPRRRRGDRAWSSSSVNLLLDLALGWLNPKVRVA